MIQRHENNRVAWDEAAKIYQGEIEKDVATLKSGGMNFCPPELSYLRPLAAPSKLAIHLQCAGGTDTLSLINLGFSEVLGIDISEEMIAVARRKTAALKMNARWLVADVIDIPALIHGTADLVYTGRGAVNWIMDLEAWGRSVAALLQPGGYFYLFEGHPVSYFFDMLAGDLKIDPEFEGYFSNKIYENQEWPNTYVGQIKAAVADQALKYERAWPVSSVIQTLLKTGLVLRDFAEHSDPYWNEFPNMPADVRKKIPNTYSLLFSKKAE